MDNLHFDDYEDFTCKIADKFDSLSEYEDMAVVAKHSEIKEILKELICIGYDLCNITLEVPDWNGYNDEYILSLSSEGIWVEKFKRESGYFEDESTVTYILDNCSSKIISHCKGKTIYEVSIGKDDDESDDENTKCVCKDCKENDCPSTTSTVKTEYRVNGKAVDKDTYEKELSKIEDKYLNNMRDMLLNYAEFVDEMNEWRKFLFW